MPGFYYDPEKKKYFKIVPGHCNGQANAVTPEVIKLKQAEEQRQKCLSQMVTSNKTDKKAQNSIQRKHGRTIFQSVLLRSTGSVSSQIFKRETKLASFRSLCLHGKSPVHGSRTPRYSHYKETHMQHMAVNSTGDYFVCMWKVGNADQIIQPLKVTNMRYAHKMTKKDGYMRMVNFDVNLVGSTVQHQFRRVGNLCWAEKTSVAADTAIDYALYTTTYEGTRNRMPSTVTLKNLLPNDVSQHNQGTMFNIGNCIAWTCAWSQQEQRIAVGTEDGALILDMTHNRWDLNTKRSDGFTQCFDEVRATLSPLFSALGFKSV